MPGHPRAPRHAAEDGGEEERCSAPGSGAGSGQKDVGKGGNVQKKRDLGNHASFKPIFRHCLHVQAPEFPSQPLVPAVPHVPLQERFQIYQQSCRAVIPCSQADALQFSIPDPRAGAGLSPELLPTLRHRLGSGHPGRGQLAARHRLALPAGDAPCSALLQTRCKDFLLFSEFTALSFRTTLETPRN